ncbi:MULTISPECIES: AAA family ATPase [Rhizobium]|uniref:Putative kinase n=1 Tax=Rhizobium paranaense TaxID=1650438 RepID=A0A7W8XRC2_9HYPH|nr:MULTISPECIES: AAA family ATPase [Rhizobium]MBB5574178.1 putative kinase [Rhizobium paranaense]PST62230.1 adenylyl-sulfate kinase [Rhizobium sp. SEMIA4064]
MLVIFGGLPGSGKTTIALLLAERLQAVHVRVDTIEQALRDSGMLKAEVGPAGYIAAYGVAEDNLRLGRTVIADSVNPIQVTRDAWLQVAKRAGRRAIEVEVVCSDKAEHRRRAETRATDVEGLVKPSWDEIVNRTYDDWSGRQIVVDTAYKRADDAATELVALLRRDLA